MDDSWQASVSAVAALGEPTRRRLYEFVVRQSDAVGRDEAAEALGLARATAAFHLDRLAEEGLLDVVHVRRTGRSGPGAGRPAKLYRRAAQPVAVSLPDRQYEFAGKLLAAAVQEADRTGQSPRAVLERRAAEIGEHLGAEARATDAEHHDALLHALDAYGFEPRTVDADVVLGNCPFHGLAQEYTNLVCGMNLCMLRGMIDGLADTRYRATLQPTPGHCCVRLHSRA